MKVLGLKKDQSLNGRMGRFVAYQNERLIVEFQAPGETLFRKAIKKDNLNRIWEPPSLENFMRQSQKENEAQDQSPDEAPQHEPSTKRRRPRVS